MITAHLSYTRHPTMTDLRRWKKLTESRTLDAYLSKKSGVHRYVTLAQPVFTMAQAELRIGRLARALCRTFFRLYIPLNDHVRLTRKFDVSVAGFTLVVKSVVLRRY